MATRKKQLNLVEVKELIQDLLNQSASPSANALLVFAEAINRGPFKEPKQAKPKALTATTMKKAVLAKFECKTVTELRKNKTFAMAYTGEKVALKPPKTGEGNTEDGLQYLMMNGIKQVLLVSMELMFLRTSGLGMYLVLIQLRQQLRT